MKAFLLQDKYFETRFQSQCLLARHVPLNSAVLHCVADLQPVSGFAGSQDFVSGIRRALQNGRQLDSWEETVSICVNTPSPIQNEQMSKPEGYRVPCVATQVQVHGPFLDDLLSKYKDLITMRMLVQFFSFGNNTQMNEFSMPISVESNEMKCSYDGTREGYIFEDELSVAWPVDITNGVHVAGTVTLEMMPCADVSSSEDLSKALQFLCLSK